MPDEKLVEHLAEVIRSGQARSHRPREMAEDVLAWLAGRGRLLPDGAEVRQGWGVGSPSGRYLMFTADSEAAAREISPEPGRVMTRRVTTWPDGSMLTTPWVVADKVEAADAQ